MRLRKMGSMIILTFLLAGLVIMAGCAAPAAEMDDAMSPEAGMGDMEEMDHNEMEGMDHDDGTAVRQFIPNDGAAVTIASPADGASFAVDTTVPVTIETVDFTIGEEGNHWHIYLDGNPIMVMGGNTFVLQNLSPGQHDIEVFLSLGTHEDLEQGDSVTITVAE